MSSTAAIRATLEKRQAALDTPQTQPRLFDTLSAEDWADLDGEAQVDLALQANGLELEKSEVETLLALARSTEAAGTDAKAESLLELIYKLQQEEGDPALKVLARHEELSPPEFWTAAEEAVGDGLVVTWSSASSLLEMSAPGVTKASTLALVCERLGVDRADVVAFGDMPNDLPMLAWAGTSYAMANAHESVIAAADHLAPDHDDDGVAQVLAGLFDA